MNDNGQEPTRNRMRMLVEVLLAGSLLTILVASISVTLISDYRSLGYWLNAHETLFNGIAGAECCLLLLWMCLGGQKSSLWNWMPPLCLFPNILWLRWVIIIALIAGTLAGILAK